MRAPGRNGRRGIIRKKENGGNFLAVNTGCNEWNNQIKPLAEAEAKIIPGCKVVINPAGGPDKRSYMVNFDLYKKLAPDHQPIHDLQNTIQELRDNLLAMNFNDPRFRESKYIRLRVLNGLQEKGYLNRQLEWIR